jgi:hypothetical protein
MQYKTEAVKKFFAKEFRRCCAERYAKFPSNEQLSKDLYVSSKYSLKVSRETIRKWLKGENFPDLDCLIHLIDWLGLNMSNVFLTSSGKETLKKNEPEFGHLLSGSHNNISSDEIDLIINILNDIKARNINSIICQ